MASQKLPPPKVVLFDIGGVVVVSPFQAILDYEIAHGIPPGYINHTISRTAPNGAWQRIERGELPLDDAYFRLWASELNDQRAWDWYVQAKKLKPTPAASRPRIDAKQLFFAMMRNSRRPDPAMWPALHRLRASGRFTIAALSNNVRYPPDCRDDRGEPFEQGLKFDEGDPYARGLKGEELARKRDVRTAFDVFVGSAEAGVRKPDPEAYKYALREIERWMRANGKLGRDESLQAGDVIFLDDIGQNLRTARQLGLRTIKVNLGKNRDAIVQLEEATGLKLSEDVSKL